jgi:hypothetical protein
MSEPNSSSSRILDSGERKLAEQSALTLTQFALDIVKRFGKKGVDAYRIEKAMTEYASRYFEMYGIVKPLGCPAPIRLQSIYTEVEVISPVYLNKFTDRNALEDEFKRSKRQTGHFGDSVRHDGMDLANKHQFLNILGAPGGGKTTFLRRLGCEAMMVRNSIFKNIPLFSTEAGKYAHNKIPVLLELRSLMGGSLDLVKCIANEFSICGFPESIKFVEEALKKGSLLILLDGLDEVPKERLEAVVLAVKTLVDKYGADLNQGNRFVTSCRTAHYKNFFHRFTDVVLADFSDDQIRHFSSNWFRGNGGNALRFISILSDPRNIATLELARTPLLLTFLCLTFSSQQELPPTRPLLYEKALNILLSEWNASKQVHGHLDREGLNLNLELDLLAEFAYQLFIGSRFFFQRQDAICHIEKFMGNEVNRPQRFDSGRIFDAIQVEQGLIVQRTMDSYSFSHLSIQEYLTASYLWDSGPSVWKMKIQKHLSDERWAVPFELLSGFGKADEVLLEMASVCNGRAILKRSLGPLYRYAFNDVPDHNASKNIEYLSRCLVLLLAAAVECFPNRMLEFGMIDEMARFCGCHDTVERLILESRAVDHENTYRTYSSGNIAGHYKMILMILDALLDQSGKGTVLGLCLGVEFRSEISKMKSEISDMLTRGVYTYEYINHVGSRLKLPMPNGNQRPVMDTLHECFVVFRCMRNAYRISISGWDSVCGEIFAAR